MKNLHLLIIGSSEEEIRKNCAEALDRTFGRYKYLEDRAGEFNPGKYDSEFVPENSIGAIYFNCIHS